MAGMGTIAVFVLSTLQQIEPVAGQVAALSLCHTRELAYQVCTLAMVVLILVIEVFIVNVFLEILYS